MFNKILMPIGTAVWLIDNTTLTFRQIGDFCDLHELEVKSIADGESAENILGVDPISNGQLTKQEIEFGEKNPNYKLLLSKSSLDGLKNKIKKKRSRESKYIPMARRHEKPDAIKWVVKNFPFIPDSSIAKLLGTSKSTVIAVKQESHWNSENIAPRDPVLLGICSQSEIDILVKKFQTKDDS